MAAEREAEQLWQAGEQVDAAVFQAHIMQAQGSDGWQQIPGGVWRQVRPLQAWQVAQEQALQLAGMVDQAAEETAFDGGQILQV